jgi:hypothetical protein
MQMGDAWTRLDAAEPGQKTPAKLGYGTQSFTVFVSDLDAHDKNAKSAGATIVEHLHETEYGEWIVSTVPAILAGTTGSSPPTPPTSGPSEWGNNYNPTAAVTA